MSQKIVMNCDENLTFEDGLERFIRSRKVKNLSEKTIGNYRNRGEKYANFIAKSTTISSLTMESIEDYILEQNKHHLSIRTINSDLSAIRTILYYFMDNGWMDRFKIELLKVDKTYREIYSDKELSLLLKKPQMKHTDFTEYKVWVMENYLMGTGNRLGSMLEIKISDLDLDSGTVLIRNTKRRRQQIIPLTRSLVSILTEYLMYRRGEPSDYLFCNTTGGQLDSRTIQQQVAAYNHKRGVEKTSIHLYRHTFATIYMKNGGDIYRLSKLLGHSSVAMTENYIQELPVAIQGYDIINPLEQFAAKQKIAM